MELVVLQVVVVILVVGHVQVEAGDFVVGLRVHAELFVVVVQVLLCVQVVVEKDLIGWDCAYRVICHSYSVEAGGGVQVVVVDVVWVCVEVHSVQLDGGGVLLDVHFLVVSQQVVQGGQDLAAAGIVFTVVCLQVCQVRRIRDGGVVHHDAVAAQVHGVVVVEVAVEEVDGLISLLLVLDVAAALHACVVVLAVVQVLALVVVLVHVVVVLYEHLVPQPGADADRAPGDAADSLGVGYTFPAQPGVLVEGVVSGEGDVDGLRRVAVAGLLDRHG